MAFKFSSVIVCELPESYASSALGLTSAVDMTRARSQWRQYVSSLEGLGCKVTILPADEKFPDCVFVEDTAVIVLGHALLTKPGEECTTLCGMQDLPRLPWILVKSKEDP